MHPWGADISGRDFSNPVPHSHDALVCCRSMMWISIKNLMILLSVQVQPRLILKHLNVVNCQLPMPTMPASDRLVAKRNGQWVQDGAGDDDSYHDDSDYDNHQDIIFSSGSLKSSPLLSLPLITIIFISRIRIIMRITCCATPIFI